MNLKIPLSILSLSFSLASEAGILCAGETDMKTRIYISVKTSGHFNKAEEASVEIVREDGTTEKNIKITKQEIVHYYEGCRDNDCKKVMIGLSVFKENFYPVNVSFLGPDYSTSTFPAISRVRSLLDDRARTKLADNKMRVSKMDRNLDVNARYEFKDVVCLMVPNEE